MLMDTGPKLSRWLQLNQLSSVSSEGSVQVWAFIILGP